MGCLPGRRRLRYYPINLDLHGKTVVIVGGGAVAARKAKRLAWRPARWSRVVAPRAGRPVAALAAEGSLSHLPRGYRPGDLEGALARLCRHRRCRR